MKAIGKYVVHKKAVTTGNSHIFFCHDPDLQVPVAVKLFVAKPEGLGLLSPAQWLLRFQAEARALAQFDHPNIVAVKAMDTLDGCPYFVMPYLAAHLPYEIGRDAGPADPPRRLPLPRVMTILKQLASALMAMHRRGMVHRFIRPSNILLSARENGQVKLADFSMVKLPMRNPPLPDHWPGPTDYCAPEQRENASAVGPQADIYSLGMLAFRMLSGTLADPARGAVDADGCAPDSLAQLIHDATHPDPSLRPAHAGVFLQSLSLVSVETMPRPQVQVVPLRARQAGRTRPVLVE